MYPGETGNWEKFGIFRRSRLEDLWQLPAFAELQPKIGETQSFNRDFIRRSSHVFSRCAVARDGAGSRRQEVYA